MKVISHSTLETEKIAAEFARYIKSGDCIAFVGGMGMGKTAFVRGLAVGMKLKDEVCSPTFSLVNEYRSDDTTLYHFDMYRITDGDDLYSIGYDDYIESDAIVIVEWSENIEDFIPDDALTVTISRQSDDENKRIITVK